MRLCYGTANIVQQEVIMENFTSAAFHGRAGIKEHPGDWFCDRDKNDHFKQRLAPRFHIGLRGWTVSASASTVRQSDHDRCLGKPDSF